MATAVYKILGQQAPAATTEVGLYTVPASTEAIISSFVVCNRGTSSATYRLSVSPDGASTASADYLVYDATIQPNTTIALTLGVTINASDVIRVYASSANMSFSAFGSEIA